MLEQLFGSKTRTKLLNLFLISGEGSNFYPREIAGKTGERLDSVRQELANLKKMGLVREIREKSSAERVMENGQNREKYYQLNRDFALCSELRALLFKSRLLTGKSLVEKIRHIGHVSYLALTGVFTENSQTPTDLLIVGRIGKDKLKKLVKEFESQLGKNLNYTIMTPIEFRERRGLTDRFLFNILENERIELINDLI